MAFVRDTVTVLTTQAVIAPVALLTNILLARLLTVHDRGLYAVATELVGVVVILAQFGWPAASIYQLRSARAAPAAVATGTLCVWLGASIVAVGGCFALQGQLLGRLFAGAPPLVLYLAVAIIPFQLLGLLFTGVARGLDRFDLHNAYRFFLTTLTLLAIAAALWLYHASVSVALTALLAVNVAAALALVVLVLKSSGLRLHAPRAEIGGSLAFSVKSYAQNVLLNIHQRVDIFIIAYLLDDPEAVALYAVAVGLVNRARIVSASIAMTMFPAVAGLERRAAARFAARISRNSLFWMTISVALLAPAAPTLVPWLFGSRYLGSVVPFLLLLPGTAALTGYMVLARYFTARNLQRVNIGIQTVATLANVTLNFALVPRYGIAGAGMASLISYSVQGMAILMVFCRESGEDLRSSAIIKKSDLLAYQRRFSSLARRVREVPLREVLRGRQRQ